MIKKENVRVMFTISKEQLLKLEFLSKYLSKSKTKIIKDLINEYFVKITKENRIEEEEKIK